VRVSVVATGIDQPPNVQELSAAETRITEVANRLRAQTATRPIDAAQAAYLAANEAAPADHEIRRNDKRVPQAPAQPYAVQGGRAEQAGFGQESYAEPPLFTEAAPADPHHGDYYEQEPYIPAAAEQPMRRQRMPQIDDLPLPGQNQLRARRGEAPIPPHAEAKQRRSLLERLASFGASRQEDHAPHSQAPHSQAPHSQAPHGHAPQGEGRERHAPSVHPIPQRPQAPGPVHVEYAGKPRSYPASAAPQRNAPAPGEGYGRPAAYPARTAEEDQLEIPAFLRRQSS
jgi:cell division protein FtsZ